MLDFQVFDADNHYYEPVDAFTRHLDPSMRKRTVQWAEIDGRQRLLVGGAVNRFIPNPTFARVSKPGALADYFRAKDGVGDLRAAFGELEPIEDRPEYRERDARLAVMDAQGIEATIMLPTLGVGMEAALEDDPEACNAAFSAFNRWLLEDWGYAYQDRIFTAPYDMVLTRFDVVEPDLIYLSNERAAEIMTAAHLRGAPELVVEIGSPSTRQRDETIKRHLYERTGVSEYWFVDPELDVVRVYLRTGEKFTRPQELSHEAGDTLTTPLLPGLALPLSRIFRE